MSKFTIQLWDNGSIEKDAEDVCIDDGFLKLVDEGHRVVFLLAAHLVRQVTRDDS